MEEDAGKLVHDERESVSYVDLNRTGTPLLEIVSEPDLRSPEEAAAYLKKLHAIVRYLDICDGNMQEGSFRCDANISLRPTGQKELGTRTELKNMNSFRNVQLALEYEVRRQRDLLLEGGHVVQQTLLWNPDTGQTESMRGKEEAHDYRYFPDPDLIPVVLDEVWISTIREQLPELPDTRRLRFVRDFELSDYDADILTASRELADYFEEAYRQYGNAKKLANFIGTEVLREYGPERIGECPVRPGQLAKLLLLIEDGTISGKIAKTVFAEMLVSGADPEQIVKDKGLGADERRRAAGRPGAGDHCRQSRTGTAVPRGQDQGDGFFRRPADAENQRPGQSADGQQAVSAGAQQIAGASSVRQQIGNITRIRVQWTRASGSARVRAIGSGSATSFSNRGSRRSPTVKS
jgi:aspartyl-tRNA(Asn)/glutamyl-tRNA(Gln) amidotransferase subunit B